MDDVFAVFQGPKEGILHFLEYLNSLRASIQFTVEIELEECLPFLDVSVKKLNNSLSFAVYRKPTHTDQYLRRDSCHPRHVFSGLVRCLKKRAESICSRRELSMELKHLERALTGCGYNTKDLCELWRRGDKVKQLEERQERVSIPYIPGLSNRFQRIFKRAGCSVTSRPPLSLGALLTKKKPEMERRGLVYRITCEGCNWSYVGETGRTLRERVQEHKRAVRTWSQSSEIANHVVETGHHMNWEGATVLTKEGNHFHRVFKEAWLSRVHSSGNRVFHQLDSAWDVLL